MRAEHRAEFAREQQVQTAIAIIQKQAHVSILQIDEGVIREWVDRGQTPGAIAQKWHFITGRQAS